MTNAALFVRLEAKPGKEKEVEHFLRDGLEDVEGEPGTTSWFAIRLGFSTFGIFDTFPDDAARQAHLTGKLAKSLMARSSQLLVHSPTIEKADLLVAKMPEMEHAEHVY